MKANLPISTTLVKLLQREALIVLTHDKLLEALPRIGYIVTKITTRDVLEVFHLRILLEVEAIGLAVEKITNKEIAELISNNRKEVELSKNPSVDDKQFQAYLLNCSFHTEPFMLAKCDPW